VICREAPVGVRIRWLFQDEARFGRISDQRRCWAPLPVRPIVGQQIIREYLYAFMAVSPVDGMSTGLILPWSDTTTMSIFLQHIADTFQSDYCVLFMDRAAWHCAGELKIPDNIRIEFLPAYSPELNPVEHIWDHVRENHFGNDVFPSLEAVEQRLCIGLRDCIERPDLMQSMTFFPWMNTLRMTLN